jgi:hypothetical protein
VASTGIRRSRPSPVVVATVAAGIVAPIVAGCATVPSSNAPRQVLAGANAVQAYVRPLPPPPPSSGLYKTPADAVYGFLSASATYAYDPAAARQFLSPKLAKAWRPGPVTVVSSLQVPKPPSSPGAQDSACRGRATCARLNGGASAATATTASVEITAQHLATLSSGGQYEYSAGISHYGFRLEKTKDGVWLINQLPAGGLHSLLLTKASFQEVYQPRNLFFFARHGSVVNGELVPDPVYAPLQSANNALNTDVATGLIEGLIIGPRGWLSDATTTAFPAGTKLVKVTLRGQVAIVDLGGTAARASAQQSDQMQAQLRATLASKAYSSPLARNVDLYIDGRHQYPGGDATVATVSSGHLVYQSGPDTLSAVKPSGVSSPLAAPRQIGSAQITALASAPGGAVAVAVQSKGGCAVYFPAAGQSGGIYRSSRIPDSAGPCTSLSWDRNGNLWAVAGGHIWLLDALQFSLASRRPQTHYPWLAVSSPSHLPSDGKSGPSILSMQVAPDGVRAALLVKTPGENRVMLAAIALNVEERKVVSVKGLPKVINVKAPPLGAAVPAWAGLSRPTALSWFSPYDLVVLTRSGIWQVPLTGGAGRLLSTAPAGAVSLASNGAALAVGTSSHGQYLLEDSTAGSNSWTKVASGALPTYPTYSGLSP